MKLYVDLETLQLIDAPGFRSPVTSLRFKRGDAATLEVAFLSSSASVRSRIGDSDTLAMQFGIKAAADYAGGYLVHETEWTMPSDTDVSPVYVCSPSFNTTALNAAIGVGGSTELAALEAMAEITWVDGSGKPASTRTFEIIIENDVNRGTEGAAVQSVMGVPSGINLTGILVDGVEVDLDCPVDSFNNDGRVSYGFSNQITDNDSIDVDIETDIDEYGSRFWTVQYVKYDSGGVSRRMTFISHEDVPSPDLVAEWVLVPGDTLGLMGGTPVCAPKKQMVYDTVVNAVGGKPLTPSKGLYQFTSDEQAQMRVNMGLDSAATCSSSEFATVYGDQTISGNKTFSGQMELSSQFATSGYSAMTRDMTKQNNVWEGLRVIPYAPITSGNLMANWLTMTVAPTATSSIRNWLVRTQFLYDGSGGTMRFDQNLRINFNGTYYIADTSKVEMRFYVGSDGVFAIPYANVTAYPANTRGFGFKIRINPSVSNQLQVALFARNGSSSTPGSYIESSWANFGTASSSLNKAHSFVLEKNGTSLTLYGAEAKDASVGAARTRVSQTPIVTLSGTGIPNDLQYVNANWEGVEAVMIGDGTTTNNSSFQTLRPHPGCIEFF